MKGLFKFLAGIMVVVAFVSVLYYLYKTKCPHACKMEYDEDELFEEEVVEKKKTAPHARGYFNLNKVREEEAIINE